MDISFLLDLISDRQLESYVEWLESNPDATEEDSSDFLMELLSDRQLDEYLEYEEESFGAELVESVDNWNSYQKKLFVGNDYSRAQEVAENYIVGNYPDTHENIKYTYYQSGDYEYIWLSWEENDTTTGKESHFAAASDPRLKTDDIPQKVSTYLGHHPEVANMYDDDDASVMMKGIIIGCVIGAIGTIFGNVASELIMDKVKGLPDFTGVK